MRTLLALLIACGSLFAETRTEAELRKELAAARAAAAASEARAKRLETGTQKLTEAVAVQAETGKVNTQKIEEVKGKIDAAQVTDHKLVETVQTQAAETRKATKQLADAVTTQNTAVTTAISEQTRQLAKSLAESREVARNLKEHNLELTKTSEADRIAKEENAKQLVAARADIRDIKFNQALAAAKDDTALRMQRYKLISDVATPFINGMAGILLALVVVFQIKATRQASATHTMVNGEREKMLKKERALEETNKALEDEVARLRGTQFPPAQ